MNFDWITDNMLVGTTPEQTADVRALLHLGVTHLINCRDDIDDAPLLTGFGIHYLWNGTPDWTLKAALGLEPKPTAWFKKSMDFWEPYLNANTPPKYCVFIHCSAGINRSATTAWAFLRALQLKGPDCDYLIDSHRLVATFGTFFDHPWREDAEKALLELGYIR